MMPTSHKFFSAIRYLVSPMRSRYRRQNASVPATPTPKKTNAAHESVKSAVNGGEGRPAASVIQVGSVLVTAPYLAVNKHTLCWGIVGVTKG